MSEPIVPVTVYLTVETHRAFQQRSRELGIGVGATLSRLADRAVLPRTEPRKRSWVRVTDAHIEAAREFAKLGYSQRDIARRVGISTASVQNHWHRIADGSNR